ncbi:NAD(P)/FAD-dependent oxidoreductase [Rhodococcus sp. BE178]|uniref:NAD(P)/FAD-dependent oxidoreductase n=1 Tax=Rhodococcus sp. BE178 TaxID=2817737 RepID=UPI003D240252
MPEYDVVIAGAGLAGSAAAILLGRKGLKVALLETHTHENSYKRLCTHVIRSSAVPTLRRLGIHSEIEDAGGVRTRDSLWTRHGWLRESPTPNRPNYGYNIRRETLDPIIRRVAAETPGVELVLGAKVIGLTRSSDDRVDGVQFASRGTTHRVDSHLVVGADGRHSRVACQSDLPGKQYPNRRFTFFAQYRDVVVPDDQSLRVWLLEPDAASISVHDDGVVVVAAMPDKERIGEFMSDREGALCKTFIGLDSAPDLSSATRLSDVIGTRDYPMVLRRKIVRKGVALIGDAAMVTDPLIGAGCGWALQSAEWLADEVSSVLDGSGSTAGLDRALFRYQLRHRWHLLPHQHAAIDFSHRREFSSVVDFLYRAATRDPWIADQLFGVSTRNKSPLTLFTPRAMARASLSNLGGFGDRHRNGTGKVR